MPFLVEINDEKVCTYNKLLLLEKLAAVFQIVFGL